VKTLLTLFLAAVFAAHDAIAEECDLFIIAGQSNAQGWTGDAAHYPVDQHGVDNTIRFYWVTPGHSSSNGKWTTLKAQGGLFKKGHFGPEVTFARSLRLAGYNPAIFKYSLGATSIANDWKGPGDGKMYGQMVAEFKKALALLEKDVQGVKVRGFVWIQGESDAQTPVMAEAYKERLKLLIEDLRENVARNPNLPVILGVDEQHPFVKDNYQVVRAQQALAKEGQDIVFTTMLGLEKADSSHLTPKGLEAHGKRIFHAYKDIPEGHPTPAGSAPKTAPEK
jgi:hypothetical protein